MDRTSGSPEAWAMNLWVEAAKLSYGWWTQDVARSNGGEHVGRLIFVGRNQARRDDRRVRGEPQVRPVLRGDLPEAGVVQHAGDLVTILRIDAHTALEDVAHRRRHCLIDLEPDRLTKPPAAQLLLDRHHQIVSLVLLEFEVGVARHPEEMRLVDRHPGEEHVQVGGDDLLQQHEAARLDLEESGQDGRHLDSGESFFVLVGIFHSDREGEAQGADVREGVPRIHRQRREHGVDLVDEPLAQGVVAIRHLVVFDEIDPRLVQGRADSFECVSLIGQQFLEARPDRLQLLGRRVLARRRGRGLGCGLVHQAGDADLEEFVHVAGEDGQELDPLQQLVSIVAGFVQDAAVELQRTQFAIDVRELQTDLTTWRGIAGSGASNDGGQLNSVRLETVASTAPLSASAHSRQPRPLRNRPWPGIVW